MSKYILVEWNRDTKLNRVQQTHIFETFQPFEERVNLILSNDNGADSIVFAGTVGCEYNFKPVQVVKEYEWTSKIV